MRLVAILSIAPLCVQLGCDPPPRSPIPEDRIGEASRAAPGDSAPGARADARDAGDATLPRDPTSIPLVTPAPFLEMEVEGHATAIVSVPQRATSRRPIVVATHGNYDRPEWQCQVWRGIVADRAFVLCPRGVARPDSPAPDDIRFTYAQNAALEKEIDDDLAALRARFPDHTDPGPMLYAGFSLGAIMGVTILARPGNAARFPRAVLVEGGHDKWTAAAIKAFKTGGGERVLFACGQPGCSHDSKRVGALLEKAGVLARSVYPGKNLGHRYDGPVADAIGAELAFVVEGDLRWPAP